MRLVFHAADAAAAPTPSIARQGAETLPPARGCGGSRQPFGRCEVFTCLPPPPPRYAPVAAAAAAASLADAVSPTIDFTAASAGAPR